jgi:purine-nucleoside phosphorylase
MKPLLDRLRESTRFLGERLEKPKVGIVLGSGLGGLADRVSNPREIPYEKIPNFPLSSVEGHEGVLVSGFLAGLQVLIFRGRFHYYEGHSMDAVTFPVRVARSLGAELLVVSNAAGSVNPRFEPGDLMLIDDHINLLPETPLRGPNEAELGPRFPSMHEAYTRAFRELAVEVASELGIELNRGVYLALQGPSLETPAEYRMVRTLGADCVGMSTVPEVIAAAHMGMKVLGFSAITNVPDPEDPNPVTHGNVIEMAGRAGERLSRLLEAILLRAREQGLL